MPFLEFNIRDCVIYVSLFVPFMVDLDKPQILR